MKKVIMSLAFFGLFLVPAQNAFAWELSNLNPLPYIGIGQNTSSFSLNPFTGFKNCNPCKKVKKCDECAQVKVKLCPTCTKAFINEYPCPCMKDRY